MGQNTGPNGSADKHVKEIKRQTRRKFSAEEKIRVVLDGLRGESSIAELCRREGIAESLYYNWKRARNVCLATRRVRPPPARSPA